MYVRIYCFGIECTHMYVYTNMCICIYTYTYNIYVYADALNPLLCVCGIPAVLLLLLLPASKSRADSQTGGIRKARQKRGTCRRKASQRCGAAASCPSTCQGQTEKEAAAHAQPRATRKRKLGCFKLGRVVCFEKRRVSFSFALVGKLLFCSKLAVLKHQETSRCPW